MSSPIDLTAEDSDVEVTGPPVIDLTKDTKPQPRRKRPRDSVRSKGTPIEGDRRPRKRHDVRGATDRARKRRAPVDDKRTKLKRDADSAFKRRAFDEAGSMFVNLAALHEEAEDFEGAGRELVFPNASFGTARCWDAVLAPYDVVIVPHTNYRKNCRSWSRASVAL